MNITLAPPEGWRHDIPVNALCNTPDEALFRNVAVNSKRGLTELEQAEAHSGHAVIVGGGPSLAGSIEEIRLRAQNGQHIFALNNTAKYLLERGIKPDWQIIIDSRPSNARFLEGAPALGVILASQCDPALFDCLDGYQRVVLIHCAMDDIGKHIHNGNQSTLTIGGGITAGITAMATVFTAGYRAIHLYGYDSSDADDGSPHAYPQNETDPEKLRIPCWVAGRQFSSSYAMYAQAMDFPRFSLMLAKMDAEITVHGDGLLPTIAKEMMKPPRSERDKYREVWRDKRYRSVSPGATFIETALMWLKPAPGSSFVDFGCGTGRASMSLARHGFKVTGFDIADNCLDDVVDVPLILGDITASPPVIKADYGYCTDLMEHISPDGVDAALNYIADCCGKGVFFSICMVPDAFGEVLIGEPLHLTVQNKEWWLERLSSRFTVAHTMVWRETNLLVSAMTGEN